MSQKENFRSRFAERAGFCGRCSSAFRRTLCGCAGARIQDGVLMTLLLLCSKFAVPVFVFITGMVLFYNYDGALKYGTFLRKRFMDIIVPYIIWSLLYELGNQLAQSGGYIHPLDFSRSC